MPAAATTVKPSNALSAQDEVWSDIGRLGERARHDRAGAIAELQSLFRSGSPSEGIDGPTEGRLVTWALHPLFDRAVGTLTGAWMPWAGKRFDATARSGDNLLARSARLPARLPWPTYSMQEAHEGLAAFDFQTWNSGPGAAAPGPSPL